jgi:hypothetical protein
MVSGKAQNKASKSVEHSQVAGDSPAGQLKQLQSLFLRFKAKAAKKRTKVWAAFEEHVKQHGESPSTRIFKARCLMLEVWEEPNEPDRAKKSSAFRDYMRATYWDSERTPHSITALCLYARFIHTEYFRLVYTCTQGAVTLTDLKQYLDGALELVKQQGTNFVNPALEVMEPQHRLPWEQCDAPDPRLQILHRSKWLRGQSNEVTEHYEAALEDTRRRERLLELAKLNRQPPAASQASTTPQSADSSATNTVGPIGRPHCARHVHSWTAAVHVLWSTR